MQDQHVIMTRGFKNDVDGDVVTGYQIHIRMPYYRGSFLSLVHYLQLAVDGEAVAGQLIGIEVCGRTFTIPQMEEADDVRWEFGDAAILHVRKAGGLSSGAHTIQVGIVIRKSYLPPEDPDRLYTEFTGLYKSGKYSSFIEAPTVISKRMTLVQ